MPADLPSVALLSIADLFRSVAARHPLRPAVVAPGVRLSFTDLDTRTDALARKLRGYSVGPGTVVGTLLLDGVAMIELLIATAKLGATILTMNWRLAAPELRHIMQDANPLLVFVSDCFEDLAREAEPERPFVIVAPDDPDGAGGALADRGSSADPSPPHEIRPDDNWLLLYSSGTTGRPKGCQHSQRSYYLNALSYMGRMGFRDSDRALLVQPLFHVGGLHTFLAVHVAGGCVIVPPRGIDHEAMLRLVSEEKVTFQTLPILDPRGYMNLHRKLALPLHIRMLHSGGGMHSPDLLTELGVAFDADIMLGYGQTEGGGMMTVLCLAEQLERPKSCGKPLPHLHVRIVDDQGVDLPFGGHGELLVKGPSTTTGYLNLPEATRETLAGGWLHTGDIFWRDAEGYLYFAGRKKELVKSGGENVYPAEVEAAIVEHPAVRQCCVVGVPDARYGEAVKAFVVLTEGQQLSPRELADWCRGRIAGYKRPRFVEFVDAIPCDFQAKPQRKMLAQQPVTPDQAAD